MSIAKFFFPVLTLYLAQSAAVIAQAPPLANTAPYSREEIDSKIDAVRKEISGLQGASPYSKAEIEAKLDGIRSDLKVLQAVNPYSKSETDTKLGAVEKTLAGKIDDLRQIEDANIKALSDKVNAIPFWLPVVVSIFSLLLAAFTWWRNHENRKVDLANRAYDLTLVEAHRREDAAIVLIDQWKDREDLAGTVGGILEHPECLNDQENGGEYRLQVLKLGNWWNTRVSLPSNSLASRAMLTSTCGK
jgi:hypothetical protein